MRDALDVADSLVASLRRGGRGECPDLCDAARIVLDAGAASGAVRVLDCVLRLSVQRIDAAFRSGSDVSGELGAILRGLPRDVLEGTRRPEALDGLWQLMSEFAMRQCRASADPGVKALAAFTAALRNARSASPAPSRQAFAGDAPVLARGSRPASVEARGFGRFRDLGRSTRESQ